MDTTVCVCSQVDELMMDLNLGAFHESKMPNIAELPARGASPLDPYQGFAWTPEALKRAPWTPRRNIEPKRSIVTPSTPHCQ